MDNSLGLDVHGTTTAPSDAQLGDSAQSTTAPDVPQWGGASGAEWGASTSGAEWGATASSGAEWGTTASPDVEWGTTAPPGVKSGEDVEDGEDPSSAAPKQDDKNKKDKVKPYVPATPAARAKMTPEELAERMEKIRLQNEKIKERREHVKADEEAFNTSVAADRAKQAANRKVQAQINQNREQNAKRKLDKIGGREWDSGKQGGEWKQGKRPTEDKGRGNSFTITPVGRDNGAPRTPISNRKVSKSSSPSTEFAKRSLHEAAPHTSQSQSDVQNSEKQD